MTTTRELTNEQRRLVAKVYDECRDLAAAAECYGRTDPRFTAQEASSRKEIQTAVSEARCYGVPETVLVQLRNVLPPRLRKHFPERETTPTKR